MITWMQRHKKWLIITIWISTIAFVGAGFVGWGQYKYGDKAGAIAKVGDIEITMGELQKKYSALYNQYSQIFQGNFDEEKAKQFGLQKQALKQLIDQSLVLNLAKSYDLEVSDKELLGEIKKQEYFFKDGSFDKELYKQILSRNNLSMKEYESDMRKQLLIQKVITLLNIKENKNEEKIINALTGIADKIEYKILSDQNIKIDTSDKLVKPFWEDMKQNFMTEVSYEVAYIKQNEVSKQYDASKIETYYNDNKFKFKDDEGKIKSLEEVKADVVDKLNQKATKNEALKTYIAFKKGNLTSNVKKKTTTISASHNPFNKEVIEKIKQLNITSPFAKPVAFNGSYYTFQLLNTNPSTVKSYEEAKKDVVALYVQEQKRSKLLELAQKSLDSFKGATSGFFTMNDTDVLKGLSVAETKEFMKKLFTEDKTRSFIDIGEGKVVLYSILEQKLLENSGNSQNDSILRLKSTLFNQGLIESLQNKYDTEIFIKGL